MRGIGGKLFAHQQPHIAALFGLGLGVPIRDFFGPATALQLTGARLDDGLQIGEHAAQGTRRQRFLATAQRGLQALVGGARRGWLGSLSAVLSALFSSDFSALLSAFLSALSAAFAAALDGEERSRETLREIHSGVVVIERSFFSWYKKSTDALARVGTLALRP